MQIEFVRSMLDIEIKILLRNGHFGHLDALHKTLIFILLANLLRVDWIFADHFEFIQVSPNEYSFEVSKLMLILKANI